MMEHPMFWLWVFTRLGALNQVAFALFLLVTFIGILFSLERALVPVSNTKFPFKIVIFVWSFLLILFVTIPTQKDAAIILGGSIAVDAIKSPVVQSTANKVNELIQGTLDDAINDLRKKKEQK